jgi:hypothetical protein
MGIVDDGLEVAHPDLSPNADTVNDHDWNDGTPDDPTGNPGSDTHGTACAGVAGPGETTARAFPARRRMPRWSACV